MKKDFRGILTRIKKFRDDRDWMRFHSHENMAMALDIEARELLDHFLWKTDEDFKEHFKAHRDEVEGEVADITAYLLELLDNLKYDVVKMTEVGVIKRDVSCYDMVTALAIRATRIFEYFHYYPPEFELSSTYRVIDDLSVIIDCLLKLADNLDIDIVGAMHKKMNENDRKYPIEMVKGSAKKYKYYKQSE